MKRDPTSLLSGVGNAFTQGNPVFHSAPSVWKLKAVMMMVWMLINCQESTAQGVEQDDATDTLEVATKKYKPKIHGFVQTQFRQNFDTNHDQETTPNRFRIQRVRLKVEGKITKQISYQIEIDPRAPQVTGLLRDAYISLGYIKKHEIRIGQQKTQFGYENTVGSSSLYFVNRTDVSDNLSRGINLRDIGIGLLGSVRINESWRFEDAITLVNGAGMNVQADNNNKKSIWGRAGLRYKTDNVWWKFGVSAAKADLMETNMDSLGAAVNYFVYFSRLGADFQLDKKWFRVVGEYVMGTDEEADGSSEIAGYYVMVAGKTPFHIGPTLRYEDMDGEFKRWTLGAYYGKPSAKIRVLANYEIRKLIDDPEKPLGEDNRFYLWLMVRF